MKILLVRLALALILAAPLILLLASVAMGATWTDKPPHP